LKKYFAYWIAFSIVSIKEELKVQVVTLNEFKDVLDLIYRWILEITPLQTKYELYYIRKMANKNVITFPEFCEWLKKQKLEIP
jgi:hypothetical protein